MKLRVPLPAKLKKAHDEIFVEFDKVADDWKKHEDEIIPTEPKLAKKIINFLVDVLTYIEKKYDGLDMAEWSGFLMSFYYQFYYGPNYDDRNYLDFDEVSLRDILLSIGWGETMSKAKVKSVKKALVAAQKKFA